METKSNRGSASFAVMDMGSDCRNIDQGLAKQPHIEHELTGGRVEKLDDDMAVKEIDPEGLVWKGGPSPDRQGISYNMEHPASIAASNRAENKIKQERETARGHGLQRGKENEKLIQNERARILGNSLAAEEAAHSATREAGERVTREGAEKLAESGKKLSRFKKIGIPLAGAAVVGSYLLGRHQGGPRETQEKCFDGPIEIKELSDDLVVEKGKLGTALKIGGGVLAGGAMGGALGHRTGKKRGRSEGYDEGGFDYVDTAEDRGRITPWDALNLDDEAIARKKKRYLRGEGKVSRNIAENINKELSDIEIKELDTSIETKASKSWFTNRITEPVGAGLDSIKRSIVDPVKESITPGNVAKVGGAFAGGLVTSDIANRMQDARRKKEKKESDKVTKGFETIPDTLNLEQKEFPQGRDPFNSSARPPDSGNKADEGFGGFERRMGFQQPLPQAPGSEIKPIPLTTNNAMTNVRNPVEAVQTAGTQAFSPSPNDSDVANPFATKDITTLDDSTNLPDSWNKPQSFASGSPIVEKKELSISIKGDVVNTFLKKRAKKATDEAARTIGAEIGMHPARVKREFQGMTKEEFRKHFPGILEETEGLPPVQKGLVSDLRKATGELYETGKRRIMGGIKPVKRLTPSDNYRKNALIGLEPGFAMKGLSEEIETKGVASHLLAAGGAGVVGLGAGAVIQKRKDSKKATQAYLMGAHQRHRMGQEGFQQRMCDIGAPRIAEHFGDNRQTKGFDELSDSIETKGFPDSIEVKVVGSGFVRGAIDSAKNLFKRSVPKVDGVVRPKSTVPFQRQPGSIFGRTGRQAPKVNKVPGPGVEEVTEAQWNARQRQMKAAANPKPQPEVPKVEEPKKRRFGTLGKVGTGGLLLGTGFGLASANNEALKNEE